MYHSNSGMARVIIIIAVIVVLIVAVTAAITLQPKSKPEDKLPSSPTASPTPKGSSSPTPSNSPTAIPITTPTTSPTHTAAPTAAPTAQPTQAPTAQPTASPSPTPKPTASPTPIPTPTPSGNTHTVDYTTMMSGQEVDTWGTSLTSGYTATLTDSMTTSNGQLQLAIWAESSSNDVNSNLWIWNVNFVNSTFFYYWVNTGAGNGPQGHLNAVNGVAHVVVTSTSIEFIGTNSITINTGLQHVVQIRTENDGSTFSGGKLTINLQ